MKKNLTQAETDAITRRVADVEARTGVQFVAAVVAQSHAYPQLPWKAFALTTTLAAFVIVVADWLRPDWATASSVVLQTAGMLLAGAAAALLVVYAPPFARLFLRRARAEYEVHRHAQIVFRQSEVFATRERTGVLLLVSLFEHRIEILPDRGVASRVNAADWRAVVARMTPLLRAGRPAEALLAGLAAAEALLTEQGFTPGPTRSNELPDRPVDAPGAAGGFE